MNASFHISSGFSHAMGAEDNEVMAVENETNIGFIMPECSSLLETTFREKLEPKSTALCEEYIRRHFCWRGKVSSEPRCHQDLRAP